MTNSISITATKKNLVKASANTKVAFLGTRFGMKYKLSVVLQDLDTGDFVTAAQWFDKSDVDEAALIANSIDTSRMNSEIPFTQTSTYGEEINGKFFA